MLLFLNNNNNFFLPGCNVSQAITKLLNYIFSALNNIESEYLTC